MFEWKKKWAQKSAVSEVLGTVLLLGMAVIIFSSLIIYVMSATDRDDSSPNLDLVGYVGPNGKEVIIEHRGGESLRLENTKIVLQKGNLDPITITGNDLKNAIKQSGPDNWGVGGYFSYSFPEGLNFWQVSATVIDTLSNSIIMSGVVNTGIDDYVFKEDSEIDGTACFDYAPEKPLETENIRFWDTIDQKYASYVINWTWDFGDNTKGYGPEPRHSYAAYGPYDVKLTVTYPLSICGANVTDPKATSSPKTVTIYRGPTAGFTWEPFNPYTNQVVTFDADSCQSPLPDGTIVSYAWSFGDGSTGTGKTTTHTYTTAKTHTVRLTVTDSHGFTDTTTNSIVVGARPPVNFAFVDRDNDFEYTPSLDIDISQYLMDGYFDASLGENGYPGYPDASIVFPASMADLDMDIYGQHLGLTLKADNNIVIDANISADRINLESTNVYLSRTKNITIHPDENGGLDAELIINAEGNVYANNTYIRIDEDGNLGIKVDIKAKGNIYMRDSTLLCYETGNSAVTINIAAEYGKLDITNLAVDTEDTGNAVPFCTMAFSAFSGISATGMDITAERLEAFTILSDQDIDISYSIVSLPYTRLEVKSSGGAVIARSTDIDAKSGTEPMLRGHTYIDFSNAEVTNNAGELFVISDSGYVKGISAVITQKAANKLTNIWFNEPGTGTGNINLENGQINNNGGKITIKTYDGDITGNKLKILDSQGDIEIQTKNGSINLVDANISTTTTASRYIYIYSNDMVNCENAVFYTTNYLGIHLDAGLYLNNSVLRVSDSNKKIDFYCITNTSVIYADNTWLFYYQGAAKKGVEAFAHNFI
ncbi:MAG: PKD domain-containing protein, partial [Thermoplasmatota archaeon]